MATPTYTLIDSTVLGSSASSVTFSSITQDYRDLVFVIEPSNTASGGSIANTFNSDTTDANYYYVRMKGDGSSTSSNNSNSRFIGFTGYSGSKALVEFTILDYSATDKHKSYLSRYSIGTAEVAAVAGRWANTSAITQVTFEGTTFNSGSTFYLYGIAS
jgi:hypothetical protein